MSFAGLMRVARALLIVVLFVHPELPGAHAGTALHQPSRDLVSSLTFGGMARTYILHVPSTQTAAGPLPLVLMLHRANGTAREMESITHMNDLADRYGFLVVYPDGYRQGWSDGRVPPLVDDIGFITSLVADLRARFEVDPARIAVAGLSNGGFMAETLACTHADIFSAAIAVAATMPRSQAQTCRPQNPVSILMIEGTADPYVPYAGGTIPGDTTQLLSSYATARTWAQLDGCGDNPIVANQQVRIADGTAVTRSTYTRCAAPSAVMRYTIWNGGHTWPGGGQYLPVSQVGSVSKNLDASTAIWLFVRAHPGSAR